MSSVDRSDKILSWAVAASTALAFGLGAARSVFVGDSGELATAVYTLGIVHPSAYPLYVLLGKLWTLLVPIGSIAFRLSLFSVAAAALACAIFYRLCRTVELSRSTAVATAFLFAFGASFWSQANVQRVYALNAVFVLWVALLTVRWLEHRESKTLTFAFFLCGLGATNHTFMAVEAIVVGIFVLGYTWREFSGPADMFGLFTKPFVAFLAGLLPYLYLPIRSRMNPVLDWGNPETPSAVIDVILRRFYWDRAWFETPGDLLVVAGNFLASLPLELTTAGMALAALGTFAALRGNRFVTFALLVVAANVLKIGRAHV